MKSPSNRELLGRVTDLAKRWKCQVVPVPHEIFFGLRRDTFNEDFYISPSASLLGLFWDARRIIYSGRVNWHLVLHELGHLVACKKPPVGNPIATDREELAMVGWEYASSLMIGVSHKEWVKAHGEYAFVNYDRFDRVSDARQRAFLERRIQVARNKGLIRGKLTPVGIR